MRVPSLSTARFAVLVALVLALFSSGIVVGAAGAPLILGQSNSAGSSKTSVNSTNDSATLRVNNTGTGRALEVTDAAAVPLRLISPAGKAPMTVNSGTKVTNLHADRLDGRNANAFARTAFTEASNSVLLPGSPATLISASVTLPGAGYVIVQASVTAFSFAPGCSCETAFAVTDGTTTSHYQRAQLGTAANSTAIANVAVQSVFTYAAGGPQTFSLQGLNFYPTSGDASASYRAITALYVPFGPTGGVPSAPAAMGPTTVAPTTE